MFPLRLLPTIIFRTWKSSPLEIKPSLSISYILKATEMNYLYLEITSPLYLELDFDTNILLFTIKLRNTATLVHPLKLRTGPPRIPGMTQVCDLYFPTRRATHAHIGSTSQRVADF